MTIDKKKVLSTSRKTKTTPDSKTRKMSTKSQSTARASTSSQISKNTKNPPATPPSNRVTKTQYFPSKHVFSNALQQSSKSDVQLSEKEQPVNASKKHKSTLPNTRHNQSSITIPSDSKITIKKVKKPDHINSSKSKETVKRPLTATLRKPSVISKSDNIIEAATASNDIKTNGVEGDAYEDDFDSYESDFDEYVSSDASDTLNLSSNVFEETSSSSSEDLRSPTTPKVSEKRLSSASTDDERKMDSGNFELSEYKHKQILDNIKESIERENTAIINQNMASLSDEGFEDIKLSLTENTQFVNFTSAQKRYREKKNNAKKMQRGQEILNMIKLDSFNFTLFDLAPVPYDQFIRLYGQKEGVQTSTQTGDDNTNEETQTETVINLNKWTQYPTCFSKVNINNPNYLDVYKHEYLGVGGDPINCDIKKVEKEINYTQYNRFVTSAGQLMLGLLTHHNVYLSKEFQYSDARDFSVGYVEFNTSTLPVFDKLSVTFISYSLTDASKILTVHNKDNINDDSVCCLNSLICLWHISNSSAPERIFTSYTKINCCCLQCDNRMVYAGCYNG